MRHTIRERGRDRRLHPLIVTAEEAASWIEDGTPIFMGMLWADVFDQTDQFFQALQRGLIAKKRESPCTRTGQPGRKSLKL